ncbi:hypothetical protein BH10PSE19_BH10PSE19_10980 [soil metagenome]
MLASQNHPAAKVELARLCAHVDAASPSDFLLATLETVLSGPILQKNLYNLLQLLQKPIHTLVTASAQPSPAVEDAFLAIESELAGKAVSIDGRDAAPQILPRAL